MANFGYFGGEKVRGSPGVGIVVLKGYDSRQDETKAERNPKMVRTERGRIR